MNQLMGGPNGTSGVDWGQATSVFRSLAFSPVVGFVLSGLLLMVAKVALPFPKLYKAPEGSAPPPPWIRFLLILTCTGVSFFHGSNDGQKGMGLIMLILIGCVPTAYALNHAIGADQVAVFNQYSQRAAAVLAAHGGDGTSADPKKDVTEAIRERTVTPQSLPALRLLIVDIARQVNEYGTLAKVPADQTTNVRNDMYLASELLTARRRQRRAAAFRRRAGRSEGAARGDRQRDQVHPDVGEGGGGDRAWLGNDDRVEAHRGDGRREDRQDAPDLCAGCGG